MPVDAIEHTSGAAGGFSSTYALPVTTTPAAGEVLVLRTTQVRSGIKGTSVSGCGATWTKVAWSGDTDESCQIWIGTGATASGTVTATFNGSTWATGAITKVRGLAATTVTYSQDTNTSSGSDVGPSLSVGYDQFVVAAAHSSNLTAFVGSPGDNWMNDPVVTAATGVKSGHGFCIPTAANSYQGTATNSNSTTGRHLLVVIG